MMAQKYQKKTNRSRRKLQKLSGEAVTVSTQSGQMHFQMVLPMQELMIDVAGAIEQMAAQSGLLMMKALIDEEVEKHVGPRHSQQADRQGYRWGSEQGYVIYAGRKVAIERPRVRDKTGKEIPLQRYEAFHSDKRMAKQVKEKVIRRVSTRDYDGALDAVCDGYGIEKSSVSRHWKKASSKQVQEMMERPLGNMDIFSVYIDGKSFHKSMLIVALGIDGSGNKHVLGLWSGETENSSICGELLDDLIARGLPVDRKMIFVLDGSKALRKAVVSRYGRRAAIQRCRIHKLRNLKDHLPREYHVELEKRWHVIWGMADYQEARKQMQRLHDWLAGINLDAAHSLEEAQDDLLTINRLGVPRSLHRALSNTNIIESAFSLAGDLCGNVKRWRDANMARRWAATVLLEAECRFNRVSGYRDIPLLINILTSQVDNNLVVA